MTDQEVSQLLFAGDGPEPADLALVFDSWETSPADLR
jgi:hypothetical protein